MIPEQRGDRDGAHLDAVVDRLLADERVHARVLDRVRADLRTTSEVGELLGVSTGRVHQLAASHAGFPEPVRSGARWSAVELERFRRSWSRDPGRRAGS